MANLGGTVLTMADVKNEYPRGTLREMAYLLEERSPLIRNMHLRASNKTTSHVSTVQTGEPTVALRAINQAITSSIGTTEQIEDAMSMMEIQTTTDIKLLELNDDPSEVRMSQTRMATNAIAKKGEELLFYGQPSDDPKEFWGLTFRDEFNALSSDHVIDGEHDAGQTDLTSIWLIHHHPEAIHAIFPKNCRGGLYHKDWGEQLVQTDDAIGGAKMPAVVDQYCWDVGLVVKDPRQIVRICNIDIGDLLGVTGEQATTVITNILFKITEAMHHIFVPTMGTPALYMGRDTAAGIAKVSQKMTTANAFEYRQVGGQGPAMMHCHGMPVYVSDQILYDETEVS